MPRMSVAQQPDFACLAQRDDQVLDGQRILGAHVDHAFGRSGSVGSDQHAFDDAVRIAFEDAAVHVRAGIAFVRIADQNLAAAVGLVGQQFPFLAGGKSGSAAPAQTRCFDFSHHPSGIAAPAPSPAPRSRHPRCSCRCGLDRSSDCARGCCESGRGRTGCRPASRLACASWDPATTSPENFCRGSPLDDTNHLLDAQPGVKDPLRLDEHRRFRLAEPVATRDAQANRSVSPLARISRLAMRIRSLAPLA